MIRRYLPHRQDIFHIILTLTLIPSFCYFEVCVVLPALFEEWSYGYLFHLFMSVFLLHNIVGNMFRGVHGPGSVRGRILTPKKDGWRFCAVCECLAPPRSWHCSTCDVCILKRDHHCNFFGCCIGYFNHRYFYMFVLHVFISTFYSFFLNIIFIIYYANINWSTWYHLLRFLFPLAAVAFDMNIESFYIFFLVVNLLIALFTGFLLIYHFQVIVKGQITPESKKESNITYDNGWERNLIDVLGKNWYMTWVSPFYRSTLPGNGTYWETNFTTKGK